jgi:hypothetical protein
VLAIGVTDIPDVTPSVVDAVAVHVTAIGRTRSGALTVYPCGPRPATSTLSFAAGQTVANAAVVAVDASSGAICVVASAPANVMVDLTGWLRASGGFHPASPVRVFDTRPGTASLRSVATTKLPAGSSLAVQVTDLPGDVSPQHVSAIVMNLTVVAPERSGWVAAHACGRTPGTSHLAFTAGQTVANLVVVPVDPASGTVCFSTSVRTHLAADLSGWYDTGEQFTAIGAETVLDTRLTVRPRRTTTLRVSATTLVALASGGNSDATPTALALNVTVTAAQGIGGVSVHSCDSAPLAANVNHVRARTTAAAVIVPVDASGDVCITATATARVIVDVVGWFHAPSG